MVKCKILKETLLAYFVFKNIYTFSTDMTKKLKYRFPKNKIYLVYSNKISKEIRKMFSTDLLFNNHTFRISKRSKFVELIRSKSKSI